MSGLSIGSKWADLILSNPTTTKAVDFLLFDLSVNGKQRLYWAPVVLRSGEAIGVRATWTTVDTPIISLCSNRPGGIVDDPQPVVGIITYPPDSPPEGP